MRAGPEKVRLMQRLSLEGLGALLRVLRADRRELIGPRLRDGAITLGPLKKLADLPAGWSDTGQDSGQYRVRPRHDLARFGHVTGPLSWKRWLFPPEEVLFRAVRDRAAGFTLTSTPEAPLRAFIGVRGCDLAAIAIQDRIFAHDPGYCARRAATLIIAIDCLEPGGTCFCASMDTGPQARGAYDLRLTELIDDGTPFYLIEAGSEAGTALLDRLPTAACTPQELLRAETALAQATTHMGRHLDTTHLPERLAARSGHPHWQRIADRCLSCSNCTLVCPTCFCATIEDRTDLDGTTTERVRRWDSCFELEHSYLVGGNVRSSGAARYRQWLTHKLAYWHAQFGTSGCTGCGRCITWCPVGIDLTVEAAVVAGGGVRCEEDRAGG